MAMETSAELRTAFDYNIREDGLAEFEPEAQRAGLWLRAEGPSEVDVRRWEPHVARSTKRWWPLIMPVVIAASAAGAAVSWVGMRANNRVLPQPPQPVVSTEVPRAEPLVIPSLAGAPSPVVESPAPAQPAPPRADATPTGAPPVNAPAVVDPALDQTLATISQAYRSLNAASLAAVWPGADSASLARTFAELKYQALSFDHCAQRPNGPSSVVASCEVSLTRAPKEGDPSLQRRRESWTIVLNRSGAGWTIAGITGDAGQ